MKLNIITHLAIAATVLLTAILTFSGCSISEVDYRAKLQNISADISKISAQKLSFYHDADTASKIEITDQMIEELTPLYDELAQINAPQKFKETQAKIKEGATANLNMLTLNKEILVYSANPALLEAQKAPHDLSTLYNIKQNFIKEANNLTTGISEVLTSH